MPELNQDKKTVKDQTMRRGLMIFAESSAWVAGPVLIALFVGRWLDQQNDSAPLYFLSLTIGAFIISSIGIGITGVRHMKQIEREEKLKKDEHKNE